TGHDGFLDHWQHPRFSSSLRLLHSPCVFNRNQRCSRCPVATNGSIRTKLSWGSGRITASCDPVAGVKYNPGPWLPVFSAAPKLVSKSRTWFPHWLSVVVRSGNVCPRRSRSLESAIGLHDDQEGLFELRGILPQPTTLSERWLRL